MGGCARVVSIVLATALLGAIPSIAHARIYPNATVPAPDPPARGTLVDGEFTCSFDPATGTLTKTLLDPGAGKLARVSVAWSSYLVEPPSGPSHLVGATREPCLGALELESQLKSEQVAHVVYNVGFASQIEILPQSDMVDRARTFTVNQTGSTPPRIELSYNAGRGARLLAVPSVTASSAGLDLNTDGAQEVTVNAPTWTVDIDAVNAFGRFDLRAVPTPALSTMIAIIGRDNTPTGKRGVAGPVTYLGPRTTSNVLVQTGDAPDRIELAHGHDVVLSAGGSDIITTGAGDDIVRAGGGLLDRINSGAGHDEVNGDDGRGAGRDIIHLGPGNDSGFGAGGNANQVFGGPGHDFMSSGGKASLLNHGPGNDFTFGWNDTTRIICGPGLDAGPPLPGCEENRRVQPRVPQPYISSGVVYRSYWCGGTDTDSNHCRHVYLYD